MSEPSFRSHDPRCSRGSSLKTAGVDKEDRSSPHPSQPPAKIARSCPGSILPPGERSPEKEYDPESPISDINLSSSPVLHSPAKHSSPAPYSSPVPSSFLVCAVCGTTPSSIPLHGCELSHIICSTCRSVGGSLLSCPRCGSQDISHHLTIAEELLESEQKKNSLVFCPYKVEGCTTVARRQVMSQHKEQCLFRPVKCPKSMFSLSCDHMGPLCTIQQHGRDKHNLHQGVTVLELGVISSKMFDKGPGRTCCDDPNNAKFQPLELAFQESLFYCYFERVADRGLWFFFIRMFGNQEQADKFRASIVIGHSGLGRADMDQAGLRYTGAVAHYDMKREEIRGKGMVLAVADEVLRSCKLGNVLFRVWFKGFAILPGGGIKLISNLISEEMGIPVSVLMGANLANEVADDKFCETTIGAKDPEVGKDLKLLFQTDHFRVTVVSDIQIVEICGALKNIVACAAGFCDGLKMGDNTKAAIIRLGLKEMMKYGDTFYPGGDPGTYLESCGVADLITTCYGGRNRRVSEAFVTSKKSLAELEDEMLHGQKLQGPETAAEVNYVLQARGLQEQFPLFTVVHQICTGQMDPEHLVGALKDHSALDM